MLFKRKSVLCSNCGFFGWYIQHESGEGPFRYAEIGSNYRDRFQTGELSGEESDPENQDLLHPFCLRRQWVWAPRHKLRSDYLDADDIRKLRQCVYYIGYQPAFGPEEHKELKREVETNRNIRNAALLGAVVGALAAIIVQSLYSC